MPMLESTLEKCQKAHTAVLNGSTANAAMKKYHVAAAQYYTYKKMLNTPKTTAVTTTMPEWTVTSVTDGPTYTHNELVTILKYELANRQ